MACFLLDFGIISSVIKTNYIIATIKIQTMK